MVGPVREIGEFRLVEDARARQVGHQGTLSPVSDDGLRGRGPFLKHGRDNVLPPESPGLGGSGPMVTVTHRDPSISPGRERIGLQFSLRVKETIIGASSRYPRRS